jgi:hypothetical protein
MEIEVGEGAIVKISGTKMNLGILVWPFCLSSGRDTESRTKNTLLMKNHETMASYLDWLIETEDDIGQIVAKAQAEGKRRGDKDKFTVGRIRSHIRFRIPAVASLKEKQRLKKLLG